MISFAASAFLTLALCFAYYLVDNKHATNPVDRLALASFARFHQRRRESWSSTDWELGLRRAVLAYSDLQSVTCVSLLASAFSRLTHGLDTYHWQIAVDLAWFSSITHLTTLTCLRNHLQKHPLLRIWRVLSMLVVALMLSCATYSTGWLTRGDVSAFPAQCLYFPDTMTKYGEEFNTTYVVANLVFLLLSYLTRIVQLFPIVLEILRKIFRTWPGSCLCGFLNFTSKRYKQSRQMCVRILLAGIHITLTSVYYMLKGIADFYSSMLWEVR